ncbi:MAG: hypothetical protein ACFCUU_04505 [Cyclobacteriaceae bacterium]
MQKNRHLVFFKIIAICLPFFMLAILELVLWSFDYGTNFPLFIEDTKHSDMVLLNPEIGNKYFLIQDNATKGLSERFVKVKPKGTFRIFVMGGSSAIGFPYHQNGSFHRMLAYRLKHTFPDKNIEIINVAMTAVNSYTLHDFTPELIELQPDAVLIYAGHNEYYGAMGVGSTSRFGSNPSWVRLVIKLRGFRIMQLASNIYEKISNLKSTVDYSQTLMKRMAAEQSIRYKSDLFNDGLHQYKTNLNKILKKFSNNNIPVFLGNLVSNEKDQTPFKSLLNPQTDSLAWKKIFDEGEKLFSEGNTEQAQLSFKKANQLDTAHAMCHFRLGQIALLNDDFEEARTSFQKARDLDALRFRAPDDIGIIINKLVDQYNNVHLVDIKKYFIDASPEGIIGQELITEHLHPNLQGYFLMSLAFYDGLKEQNLIDKQWDNEIPVSVFAEDVPITRVDSLYGAIVVSMLRELWPFNEDKRSPMFANPNFEEKIAGGLAVKTIGWTEAFKALLKQYLAQKDFENALKITENLIAESPEDPTLLEGAGYYADKAEKYYLTDNYYTWAFKLKPSIKLAQKIVINKLKMDEPEMALPFIQYVVSSKQASVDFRPLYDLSKELVELKKLFEANDNDENIPNKIAGIYIKMGNYAAANKYILKALDINKESKESHSLIRLMEEAS